ncbi:glycosyltransferase family 2 protein [Flavimarina sp. Hel_I_48]|uniref:glycosyltransferase family 2 protein n=1 Tax=Flavimarina sp. Hel_I_48 TaxID=1392488 RepID=UPI0004DF6D22|nr:glycosyltransferase family 2 protein [Flavimarina sp. Hel_I_48]
MNISLIICTYQRSEAILKLLRSVVKQTHYPEQVLVVDASEDERTRQVCTENEFESLEYCKVSEEHRGLTKQRNFGVLKTASTIEIIAFLDDDIVLKPDYFEKIKEAYRQFPEAWGVGGYISNDVVWNRGKAPDQRLFEYDGYYRKDGSRFLLRKKLGLEPDRPPAHLPDFSHGRSVGFLPPSGKIYDVEQFMGGVASYKKSVFDHIRFSTYFEGYGLYEDADFTLRLSKLGKLYVHTAAQVEHHHDASGRPAAYKYGKMVVRNGWYIWRVKYPKPGLKARLKWNATSLLLTLIRYSNIVNTSQKKEAFLEAWGRTVGWFSLLINKPVK